MRDPKRTRKTADNFIRRYSAKKLSELIAAIQASKSGQEIADSLGVSRERVRQWRHTFGVSVTSYLVHPEVQVALRSRQSSLPEGSKVSDRQSLVVTIWATDCDAEELSDRVAGFVDDLRDDGAEASFDVRLDELSYGRVS